jgi:hypothetical protein
VQPRIAKRTRRIGTGIPISQRSAQPIFPLNLVMFNGVFISWFSGTELMDRMGFVDRAIAIIVTTPH